MMARYKHDIFPNIKLSNCKYIQLTLFKKLYCKGPQAKKKKIDTHMQINYL